MVLEGGLTAVLWTTRVAAAVEARRRVWRGRRMVLERA